MAKLSTNRKHFLNFNTNRMTIKMPRVNKQVAKVKQQILAFFLIKLGFKIKHFKKIKT